MIIQLNYRYSYIIWVQYLVIVNSVTITTPLHVTNHVIVIVIFGEFEDMRTSRVQYAGDLAIIALVSILYTYVGHVRLGR